MLTVQEVLSHKQFKDAEIIAGKAGLHHTVKWIHIMEVLEVQELIKGDELLLMTGMELKNNESGFIQFIQQLAAVDAAGVCIEYGRYLAAIPERVKKVADELQLPIIVFHKQVRFVDITQSIHTEIISQQYEALKVLEDYAQKINKYSLKVTDAEQILMYMQKYLQLSVVYESKDQPTTFIPNRNKEVFEHLSHRKTKRLASRDIHVFEQPYGKVYIYALDRDLTDLDTLILDRTVVTLSQYALRELYTEEKLESEHRQFLEQWLDGAASDDEVTHFLQDQGMSLGEHPWFVMVHQLKRDRKKKDLMYYKINLRQLMEKEGFRCFILEQQQYVIFILGDLRDKESYRARMKRAMNDIISQYRAEILIGIGKYGVQYNNLVESVSSAKTALHIRMKNMDLPYFYDDLNLHHMIFTLQKDPFIMRMVAERIELLSTYDTKHNGSLMDTLQMYFLCNGQKKETAEKLFIVRQTLYHRLEKIEQILAMDLMNYHHRILLEMMLLVATQKTTPQ